MAVKMSKSNWYRRFLVVTKGIFLNNPILSMGLALPFAVVACTSLQTAVGLSIGALMALIPAALILPLVMKQIPQKLQWLDYPLCALLSAVFLMPTRLITGNLSPALMDSVGVYFSLFCVSSLLFTIKDECKEKDLASSLLTLIRMWLGVALVLALLGSLREILGYGTIWNKPLTFMKIRFSGVMVSGCGFILLGFLAALGKKFHRTILYVQFWVKKQWPILKEKVAHLFDRSEKANKKHPAEAKVNETEDEISMGKEQDNE